MSRSSPRSCASVRRHRDREAHVLGAPDDVAVGEHEAVAGDNNAGADAGAAALDDTFDPDDRGADAIDHCSNCARIRVERPLILWVADRSSADKRHAALSMGGTSKIDDAELGSMRDGVGAADRVEFIEQRADMELGSVNGNAKPARDLFVRCTLSKQRKNLELAWRQRNLAITQSRSGRRMHQGCISGFARTH